MSNFGQMRRTMQTRSLFQQPARFGFATMEKTFLASDLQVNLRPDPKTKPAADHQYLFGALQTDHMLEIDYDLHNGGW